MVPLNLNIDSINSDDINVAVSNLSGNPPVIISVSRRPNKRSARIPAKGNKEVGIWEPKNQGFTTVRAKVDVYERFNNPIALISPSDNVEVL